MIHQNFHPVTMAELARRDLFGRQGSMSIDQNILPVTMVMQARGDVGARQGRICIDQDFQRVILAAQAISARHLFGREAQKFVGERLMSIHCDLRKKLSSSLGRGGSQLTRTAMNEEKSLFSNSLRASSNDAQELCDNSPRQGFLCSENLEIGSACRYDHIKGSSQSPVRARHSQDTPHRAVDNIFLPSASTITEAIGILRNLLKQGNIINSYTFVEVLKRCLKQKDLIAARQVHDCISQSNMDKNPYVASTLLNVYIRCGRLQDACRVFDRLDKKTSVTWGIMIAGFAENGQHENALEVFNRMLQGGSQPSQFTCLSILKACASPLLLKLGKEAHAYIRHAGLESDVRVGTALVQMYAKCGCITEARRVFEKLTNRNVVTWNVMIGAYAESGCGVEARRLYLRMEREGFKADAITYLGILNASAGAGPLEFVREVHGNARKTGLESDLRVANALIHMYAKSGCMDDSRLVFDRMKKRDVITWNIMIGAYAESGRGVEAYGLFLKMKQEGFIPDAFTYASILNPSTSEGALEWAKEVHGHARRAGLESDLRVGSALVHMYAKSGNIDDARLVFDRMEERDVITWNLMIGGYADSGYGVKAYDLFLQMNLEGFTPNAFTYTGILNASAAAGALEWVKGVYGHARRAGLESDLRVGGAFVHMYAKSGSIDDARLVFDRMEERDVGTFNAMIGGLAVHGCGDEALKLFKKMIADCVKPDETSFVAILSACCHAGLVDDGRRLFDVMMQDYAMEPTIVHCNCKVDLLGRAGHLEEAKLFIDNMPLEPNAVTWGALLGACRTYGNVELGEVAAKELLKLEPKHSGAYVLLSNIYAATGKWEKVLSLRKIMEERGVRKEPGRSWIEVNNTIHEFVVGDTSHPEATAIYSVLQEMTNKIKAKGYIPDTRLVLRNIDEEDKEVALCSHSEKLAIAYGLLRVPRGKPIRVEKNLRVCSDCHAATKLMSEVSGREIIVRDANRFHHFKDGVCSCGDYW